MLGRRSASSFRRTLPAEMRAMTIQFYAVLDEYGEFSNFAAFPITIGGKRCGQTLSLAL